MRSINKMGLLAIVVTVALTIWATAFSGSVPQSNGSDLAKGCNVHNVAGNYPYTAFGTIHPDHPLGYPPGPYTSAGVVTLLADGTYTSIYSESANGTVVANQEGSGTWSLSEDCVVTMVLFGMPLSVTYATDDRKQIYGMFVLQKTNIALVGARR